MEETQAPERWLSRTASRAKRTFSVKKSIRRVLKREGGVEGQDTTLNGLDSREYEFLCNVCTQLLTSPSSQKKLFSKDGFSRGSGSRLYHKEGCRLCQQMVEVLSTRSSSGNSRDFSQCTLHALDKNRKYIYQFQDHGFGYGVGVEERTSGPSELTQLAFLQVRLGPPDQTDINLQRLLAIAPCFNDVSEKMFASPNLPVHDFDLSGDFLIRRARAQIRECRKNHIQCKGVSGRLPRRVIDVHPSGDDSNVRLHLTGRHENMTYVALSYCWGGNQKIITTSQTLATNIIGIPKANLDATIQDAILITRKLGHHYLWVDSLCIIQDDEEDRGREIAVMDEIYGNATLTIAASSAKSAREGFLGPSKASTLETRHKFPLRLPDGQMGFITAIAEKMIRGETGWPLDSRAWALSEFILSRRILMFGDGDVRYQCRKQDYEAVVPSPLKYDVHIPRIPKRYDDLRGFLKVKWYDLIEDYTRRALTDEKDRLIAISSVVKQIQGRMLHGNPDREIEEYFAGLWKSGLAGDLLWYRREPLSLPFESSNPNHGPPTAAAIPTFSWASLGSNVNFLGVLTASLEFIQWGVRVDSFRSLGSSTTGQHFSMLTLKAYVLPLSKLVLSHLPKLCQVDAITLEDLKSVLHIWEDYEGREGFELSDSSVLMRVDDGANSRDNRGLILNRSEGKYFRRIGVYSELDWNSRPKSDSAKVEPSKVGMITRLQSVISKPAAWEGYTRAEITLV